MATTKARNKALWIAQFLVTLKYKLLSQPVTLKANNRGVILLIANPEFYWHTKHIEVQYYWIQEKIDFKKIVIFYISTKDMIADRLTKALDLKQFKAFQSMIGMH